MVYLRRFMETQGPDVLVLLSAPVEEWGEGLAVEELARSEGGIERTEKHIVYRVEMER